MSNAFDHENTPTAAFGEFDTYGTEGWTDEDWAQYDARVAAEIAEWEEQQDAEYGVWDFEGSEPPF